MLLSIKKLFGKQILLKLFPIVKTIEAFKKHAKKSYCLLVSDS